MTIAVQQHTVKPNRLALIDCDIHTRPNTNADLKPYLSQRWWDHLNTYGFRLRHGFTKGHPYPKSQPGNGARRDAWPPNGAAPGSDLAFMQAQHLDHYGIDFGIMNPLSPTGQGDQNPEFSAAMATCANDWQIDLFTSKDPRLKASIVVPYENAAASKAEIRRHAGNRDFAHVLMMSRPAEAHGRRRYWPIYEAACEAGLPIGIHVFGYSGYASSNTGWLSYYVEEMTEHETSCSALVMSMIMEGVFEEFPDLKVVLIEAGFAWLPALGWRLDRNWRRLEAEVPHVKKLPSEYIRQHFWISTQPMEEPEHAADLIDVIDWIGDDRILFASDYPHWDFDDPHFAIPTTLGEERRARIFAGNARALYKLG